MTRVFSMSSYHRTDRARAELRYHRLMCRPTVSIDIFACIDFCGFKKMVNFACIKIRF